MHAREGGQALGGTRARCCASEGERRVRHGREGARLQASHELLFPQLDSERKVPSDLIKGGQNAKYLFRSKHSSLPTHLKRFLFPKGSLRSSELQRITWGVADPRGSAVLRRKGHPALGGWSPRTPGRVSWRVASKGLCTCSHLMDRWERPHAGLEPQMGLLQARRAWRGGRG